MNSGGDKFGSTSADVLLRAKLVPIEVVLRLILFGDSQRLCNPSLAKFLQKCSRPRPEQSGMVARVGGV